MKLRVRAIWSCNICLPESARCKDIAASFLEAVFAHLVILVRFVDLEQITMSNIFTKLTKGGMRHAEAPQLPGAWSEVSLPKQRTISSKFKACCARWGGGGTYSVHMPVHSVNGLIFLYRFIVAINAMFSIIYYIVIFLKLL